MAKDADKRGADAPTAPSAPLATAAVIRSAIKKGSLKRYACRAPADSSQPVLLIEAIDPSEAICLYRQAIAAAVDSTLTVHATEAKGDFDNL